MNTRKILRDAGASALKYLNPAYHVKRMIEDLSAATYALKSHDYNALSEQELARTFRGKLFGSFFVGGIFSFFGPISGGVLQALTHNLFAGWYGTVLVTPIVSSLAFQVVWWKSNRQIYEGLGSIRERFLAMQRDVLPVQWQGLRWGLSFAAILSPPYVALIAVLRAKFPDGATMLPVPLIVMVIDTICVNGTFVRIMGDIFDRHSQKLADRYGLKPVYENAPHAAPVTASVS